MFWYICTLCILSPRCTYDNGEASPDRGEDWKHVTQGSQRTVVLEERGKDMGEDTACNDMNEVPEYLEILRPDSLHTPNMIQHTHKYTRMQHIHTNKHVHIHIYIYKYIDWG